MNNILKPEDVDFDTKVLSYIIAIVDERGLSRAAEKLYLSQPALSRYLRKVEESLGTPIFLRMHNELQLTNAGKLFINGARSMLHIEQEALKNLCSDRHEHTNTLSVAAQSMMAELLSQKLHPLIQEAHPNVQIHLTVTSGEDVRRKISDGVVDLGIFLGDPVDNPFYDHVCLYTSELVFYAAENSPGLELCKTNGFRLNNFAGEPMMMSLEDSYLGQKQERLLKEHGINAADICVRGRLPVLMDLIRLGYGNVILPHEAANLPKNRTFPFTPHQPYSCLAAWCKGRPLPMPAEDYIAFAQKVFH